MTSALHHPRHAVRHTAPLRLLACAAAALTLLGTVPVAQAVVVIAGTGFTQPGSVPGDDLQWVGNGVNTTGTIDVTAGSTPTFGGLFLGWNQATGSGLIDGAGTTLALNNSGQRLVVGNWGAGGLAVTNGAKILADGNAASCNGACGAVIGNFPGTTGTLLISGAGSEVRIRDRLELDAGGVDTARGFGTVGGHATAVLTVENGGQLYTGGGTSGGFSSGRPETSTARITVSGAGSLWSLSPDSSTTVANRGPFYLLSNTSTNESFLSVVNGGEMRFNGSGDVFSGINMGGNGGTARLSVSGTGSKIQFNGESSLLQVARTAGSQAQLSVTSGGAVQGLYYMVIGRDGGNGVLLVDGAGSKISLTGTVTAAANTTANVAILDIGRAAGSMGSATVSHGGLIEVLATTAKSNSPAVNLGRDGGIGALSISGAGSLVRLVADSVVAGGGAAESRNPSVSVGVAGGTGNLSISAGGKLLLQGNAVSTVANSRSTVINVGGTSDTTAGGTGVALVTGLGSEMSLAGSDGFIGIGRGPGASGILTVADQAVVRSQSLAVGRSGGVGTLTLNNASVFLAGQQTGNNLAGANIAVGNGGGTGILNMANNALLRLDNASGTVGPVVNVGGSGAYPGGQGIVTMASGARIELAGPSGAAGVNVGRDGSGVLTMTASTVDVGSAGSFVVARNAGSSGVVNLSNNSTITADFIGVGRGRNADLSTFSGGVGSLVVNSGSAVTANTIEIGSAGYLGGNGTINGNVVNFGTINPGNSPGTLMINGNYTAGSGGKLVLEVESDGHGGYSVDHIIFGAGGSVSLAGAQVAFKFLAGTDPTAFNASGQFDIDTFLMQTDASGKPSALGDAAFAGVSFTAEASDYRITSFSYNPSTGVTALVAVPVPVPEPGGWALMLAGLAGLSLLARRRSA